MIHINYYLNDHTFLLESCYSGDYVRDFLKKIKMEGFPIFLNGGVPVDGFETFEKYIDKLHYNALFISYDPFQSLSLPDIKFNFEDYKDIEFIDKNEPYEFKAINKITNQKVFIISYQNFYTSSRANITRGIYIMNLFNLPSIPKILSYKFAVEETQYKKLNSCNGYSDILVTKYYENGRLSDNIIQYFKTKGAEKNKMNPTNRSKIIFGVAATMKHLHEKQILLNFLKSENVYLDENFEPVLTDFRFAKFFTDNDHPDYYTNDEIHRNPTILSIERVDENPETTCSDVFMYGVFIYRMFSDTSKIYFSNNSEIRSLYQYSKEINSGLKLLRLKTIPDHYWELIEKCMALDYLERPSFDQIVKILRDDKFALNEFGMKTDLEELHEYQNRIDSDEITKLKSEISSLKKKIESLESPKQPKLDSSNIEILKSDMISKLRTIREISIGGFARVLEVGKEEIFALKVMHSNEFDIEKIRSFFKEYELLNQLRHPFIVKTFGIFMGDENKSPSILLEFCISDLKKEMKKSEEFDKEKIVKWVYQIAEAMRYIHKFKIVHRDLKPSNILVGKDGNIRVSDFGIAKLMSAEEQTTTFGDGTQFFMAPEILNALKYNEKADVYSFGVLLYFILSKGQMPKITIIQIGTGKKAKIPDNFTQLAKELIDKCWNFNPGERPSFEEILNILSKNNYKILDLSKSQVNSIKLFVNESKKQIPK